jgi:hypothetical protein
MEKAVYEFISKQTGDPIVERRTCARTGQEFAIFQGDVELLDKISPIIWGEKISLPLPTLSPLARMRRRMLFRNERGLYNAQSILSWEKIISTYCPDLHIPIVSSKEAMSFFDATKYGMEYDSNKSFMTQYRELFRKVPKGGTITLNNENGNYDNYSGDNKNTYLNADIMNSENVAYSTTIKQVNNGYDLLQVHDSDMVYQCNGWSHLTNCFYVQGGDNCYSCGFSFLIKNCTNCRFCNAIQNKQNYIFNKPASKEEIDKIKVSMKSYEHLKKLEELFYKKIKEEYIKPSTWNVNCENSFGANIYNAKNAFWCYDSYELEDCRYVMVGEMNKDCVDTTIFNPKSSMTYENINWWLSVMNSYCSHVIRECSDIYFSDNCMFSSYLIWCSGLKNAHYCILNKQYQKEERESLAKKIFASMREEKTWGEFFDSSMSLFPYNDTVAMDRFPVYKVVYKDGKEEIIDEKGSGVVYIQTENAFIAPAELDLWWSKKVPILWRTRNYEVNIPPNIPLIEAKDLLDNIDDIDDSICDCAIICEKTKRPFRITKLELAFYRKMGLALPRLHPSERYRIILKRRPQKDFSLRKCDKTNEIEIALYDKDAKHPVYSQKEFEKLLYW